MKSVKSRERERERERVRIDLRRDAQLVVAMEMGERSCGSCGRSHHRCRFASTGHCAHSLPRSPKRDFVVVVPLLPYKYTQNEENTYSTLNPTTKKEACQIFLLLLLLHVGILEGLEWMIGFFSLFIVCMYVCSDVVFSLSFLWWWSFLRVFCCYCCCCCCAVHDGRQTTTIPKYKHTVHALYTIAKVEVCVRMRVLVYVFQAPPISFYCGLIRLYYLSLWFSWSRVSYDDEKR